MSESLTLLRGHISPETAYVVDDYPYGRTLRCKIRYWLDKAVKGSGKGETRFMSQTTDPKKDNLVWNKPKSGVYHHILLMYQDGRTGYIHSIGLHYPNPDSWARFFAYGLYQQMNEEEKKEVDRVVDIARKLSLNSFNEWEDKLGKVSSIGDLDNPNLYDKFSSGENHIYRSTFDGIVGYLNALQGKFTLPALRE